MVTTKLMYFREDEKPRQDSQALRRFGEDLLYQFCQQNRYFENKQLRARLYKVVPDAYRLAQMFNIDAALLVRAIVTLAPVFDRERGIVPEQLTNENAQNYVSQYLDAIQGDEPETHFKVQCRTFFTCLDNGWDELLCLKNPTFQFASWFRILMATKPDEELIKKYRQDAVRALRANPAMLEYLKSVHNADGLKLDLTRIFNE